MAYRKIQLKDPEGLHARNSVQICMAVRQRDVKVVSGWENGKQLGSDPGSDGAECGLWGLDRDHFRRQGRNRGVGCGSGDPAVRCGLNPLGERFK